MANNREIAESVLKAVGGAENVTNATHCMTRLRLNLKDETIPKDDEVKAIGGVLGVVRSGGQYQVVIGQNVPKVYAEVCSIGGFSAKKAVEENLDAPKEKLTPKKIFNNILNYLAGSLTPLIPVIVAAAMFKTVLAIIGPDMLKLVDEQNDLYILLNFVYNAGFYFLPIYLGYTAAKKLGTSEVLGMFLGGILIAPALLELVNSGAKFTVYGIPASLNDYSQSVLPMILSVWVMKYVHNFFKKIIPDTLSTIFVPFLTMAVMVPVSLCALAPLGSFVGNYVGDALLKFGDFGGFAAMAVIAALWAFLVMSGMHVVLVVTMITLIMSQGSEALIASLDPDAVYAKALAAVTAAVEAKREDITEQVTAAVQAQVEAQVTQAVHAEVETQVRAAVREQLRPQVEAAVRTQVRAQVEAAVRETVTAQVILAATGLDVDSYNAAVAAGQIDEDTQAAIQAQIEAQMESEEVQQTIEAQTDEQMASDAVQQTIEEQLDLAMNGADAQAAIAAAVDEQMQSEQVQATIAQLTAQQMASDEIQAVIAQNVEAQIQQAIADAMAGPEVQAQLAAASEGAQKIMALKTSLDSYNAFYLGLLAYTNGVSTAASGAKELASGAAELKSGVASLSSGAAALAAGTDQVASGAKDLSDGAAKLSSGAAALSDGTGKLADGASSLKTGADALAEGQRSLYDGIAKLQEAMPALTDGVTQLRDGAMELSEGLQTFYDEGISKILEAVDEDLPALLNRLRAISSLSNAYQTFTGIAPDTTGTVKFIYRTEEIGG